MKRWNAKSFFAGGLVTALIMGLGVPALAATVKTVELYYNNIQIRLNGKTITPKDAKGNVVEPFVIDGTTYLPIRAIGEALGLNVNYDGKTSTVILGNDPEKGQPAKWLGEMEAFTGSPDENKIERDGQYTEEFTANNGDTFDRFLYIGSLKDASEVSASYLLKGEYNRFTGTIYLNSRLKNTENKSKVKIYLDEKLVYTSPEIGASVLPVDFDINTSGAYKIEIVCIGGLSDPQVNWQSAYATLSIANAALWTN